MILTSPNAPSNALQSIILSDGSETTVAKQLSTGDWFAPVTFSQSFAQNFQIHIGIGFLRVVMRYFQIKRRISAFFGVKDDRKALVFVRTIAGEVLRLDPPSKFTYQKNGFISADEPTLAVPCSVLEIASIERTETAQ